MTAYLLHRWFSRAKGSLTWFAFFGPGYSRCLSFSFNRVWVQLVCWRSYYFDTLVHAVSADGQGVVVVSLYFAFDWVI